MVLPTDGYIEYTKRPILSRDIFRKFSGPKDFLKTGKD